MATPVLRIVIPDQPFRELGLMLGKALVVKVEPGAVYTVIDDDTKDVIEDVALSEVENNLIIELDGEVLVQVEGFFAPALEGEAESYVYAGVTDASGAPQLVSGGDTLDAASDVLWGGAATDAGSAAPAGAGSETSSFADIPGWVLAGLGLGAAVGAGFAVAAATSGGGAIPPAGVAATVVIFNFTTGVDTVDGVAQAGAGAFAAGVNYDIRIYVLDNSEVLDSTNITTWTGGSTLGAGDKITLSNAAGSQALMNGEDNNPGITGYNMTANAIAWLTNPGKSAFFIREIGSGARTTTAFITNSFDLWTGTATFATTVSAPNGVNFV